jgi:hypothetical protein
MKKLKSKKLLSLLMAGTMVLSMAACGGEEASTPDPTQAPAPTEAPAAEPTAEPAPAPVVEDASIDFEDGNMGFLQVYTVPANADAANASPDASRSSRCWRRG